VDSSSLQSRICRNVRRSIDLCHFRETVASGASDVVGSSWFGRVGVDDDESVVDSEDVDDEADVFAEDVDE